MARLSCPVPGCNQNNFIRQAKVNIHLREHHRIHLTVQQGGNMNELRQKQQVDFSNWLQANGHSQNISLFTDVYFEESLEEEASDVESFAEGAGDEVRAGQRKRINGGPDDGSIEGNNLAGHGEGVSADSRPISEAQARAKLQRVMDAWVTKEATRGEHHDTSENDKPTS